MVNGKIKEKSDPSYMFMHLYSIHNHWHSFYLGSNFKHLSSYKLDDQSTEQNSKNLQDST